MTCPSCGAALQRLHGADGWQSDPCIAFGTFRIIEVKRLHAVYACPGCEFATTGKDSVMTADIVASIDGSIVLFAARTARGRAWLAANTGGETIAEHRYGIDILRGMVADGLRVQDAATGRFAARHE